MLPSPPTTSREAAEILGADDETFAHTDEMDAVRQHWDELPEAQRKILLMRFYGNMTQAQVADRLHCSQMHISRSHLSASAGLNWSRAVYPRCRHRSTTRGRSVR